jgi:crossover junction endodeoxyribonuclease RuvC
MRILGIDPGIISSGYGVVDAEQEMQMVDCGALRFSSQTPVEERLCSLYGKLTNVIDEHHPNEVAIEEPFVGRNARSAFAIGRAQAIAILAAASQGLPVYYYSPAQVKQQVTNYGRSDKQQVQEMVKILLKLPHPPQPDDAADALAVAICHIQQSHLSHWLAEHMSK